METFDPVEQKTLKLYEDIHPFADNEISISNYLKTTGLPEDFFKGKDILDCGFGGTGWALELFARSLARSVTGIDLNDKWVQTLSGRLAKYHTRLDLRTGSVLHLPFADNTFDYVHSNGVMHHTVDWKKGVSEMSRVLKPGGTLFLMLYGKFGPIGRLIHGTYRFLGKVIPYAWTAFAVKKTGLFRDPEISILDAMYVPIEEHLNFSEIRDLLESLGMVSIERHESFKWKQKKIASHPFLFGPNIQHNVLAVKL